MINDPAIAPLCIQDRWAGAIRPKTEGPPSMRIFGLVMLLGFGLLGSLLLWHWHRSGAAWQLWLGTALALVGLMIFAVSLVSPGSLPPVYSAWMKFGQRIGAVVSAVLLTVVYFFVVTPVGLAMRISGTDPLERRVRRDGRSYWHPHPPMGGADDYEHMS